MNLIMTKTKKGWKVDCSDLPGSPSIGDGRTKYEAIAAFFIRNMTNPTLIRIKSEPLTINNKLWKPGI